MSKSQEYSTPGSRRNALPEARANKRSRRGQLLDNRVKGRIHREIDGEVYNPDGGEF